MLEIRELLVRTGQFELSVPRLSIGKGNVTAVIGPSGGGKSTLLGALAGFHDIAQGSATLNGRDLAAQAAGDRDVAIVFQENNLFPHLDVASNVGLGANPKLRLDQAAQVRVQEAIDQVGLSGLEARKPAALSGGQRGRVALARLLVQDRALWLLDEPFAALGPAMRTEMMDLVVEMAKDCNATILFVTHQPEDARRIADQVALVVDGKVSPARDTDALFTDPPESLRSYLGN